MRISTTQMFQSGVSSMQRNQAELNHTSLQLASGRRILTPSDDPGGAAQVMRLESAIRSSEQYQRNIDTAQPKLEQEEAHLDAVQVALQRARELIVAANNDTYSSGNREIMAAEIRQFRDDILGLANAKDANGEYLFGGTRSDQQPFIENDDGVVQYVGAEGASAVRELQVSETHQIAIGDSGANVFMDIPEQSGLVVEAVVDPQSANIAVQEIEITNLADARMTAGKPFHVEFVASDQYRVVDDDGKEIQEPRAYANPISFGGREILLGDTDTPAANDRITVRPMEHVSIFKTLDDVISSLENSLDSDSLDTVAEQTAIALENIDAGIEHFSDIRASVGLRIQDIETQTDINAERQLNLQTTISEIRDLDFAEAISRFNQQQATLEAAQQTYVQVSRLSLFNFL